ncbi:Copia protein [Anthophora plagiata]
MSKAQLLKYSNEKSADRLWSRIKNDNAAQTEQLKVRSLREITNLKMKKDESIDEYLNRAEALKNQCIQLGKEIEEYELKMKVRERQKSGVQCYNCRKIGHTTSECYGKKKCYNCHGINHIAAECKVQKKFHTQRGRFVGRARGRGRGNSKTEKRTSDEAVMTVSERTHTYRKQQKYENTNKEQTECAWLLDSGSTSHMANNKEIFDSLKTDEREIGLAGKEGKILNSTNIGEIVVKHFSIVHGKTPYEIWHGRRTNIRYMKIFGCIAYLLNKHKTREKFELKTIEGIFVGYVSNNTYRIYIPETGKIRCDCDIKFNENRNGVEILSNKENKESPMKKELIIIRLESEDRIKEMKHMEELGNNGEERVETNSSDYEDANSIERENDRNIQDDIDNEDELEQRSTIEQEPIMIKERGRPKGTTKDAMKVRRYTEIEENKEKDRTNNVKRSKRISDKQTVMLTTDKEIPRDVTEAKNSDNWYKWQVAMDQEMASIKKHGVWNIVPRPENKRVIPYDMVTILSSQEFEDKCMKSIRKEIDLKDIGPSKSILGMQIEQKGGNIYVHQKKYIERLLYSYGMMECNAVTLPIDVNVKMENYEESEKCNTAEYQELMGKNKQPQKGIECETDASWDRTKDTKSFTGLLIYRNGDLLHWKCKKQRTVALSSTESEIDAMLDGVKESIWIGNLIKEIGLDDSIKRGIRCDNLNAVKLANGGNFKTKCKLLNRKCHFIREAVKDEELEVYHTASDNMNADCLTKPLSGPRLLKNVKFILNTGQ